VFNDEQRAVLKTKLCSGTDQDDVWFLKHFFYLQRKRASLGHTELLLNTMVARFFLIQHTKTGKTYQMTIKYTEWPKIIPNGQKLYQIAVK
jgi:hypothetical protein